METFRIGNRDFLRKGKTYVMGIVNVTPDSFSDGGQFLTLDAACRHTEEMIAEGADLIDVGGESTRPGHRAVGTDEECDRVLPVIEAIKARFDIPVSLDTSKPKVAELGIRAGADLINDVWGLRAPGMAKAVGDKPVCIMHNADTPAESFEQILTELAAAVENARRQGVDGSRIMIDPGIGFAKSPRMNLVVLNRLEAFGAMGYPVLLGVSNKSVVGHALDLPVTERREGNVAASVVGVTKGVQFVRVHFVKENVRAIRMTEAILGEGKTVDNLG